MTRKPETIPDNVDKQAYIAGYNARYNCKSMYDNPYKSNLEGKIYSNRGTSWKAGWLKADEVKNADCNPTQSDR